MTLVLCLFLAVGTPAAGAPVTEGSGGEGEASATADKSRYNLFHPTPDNLLRPFGSSRPDQITGAYTVDAGHYYYELGFIAYSLSLGVKRVDSWNPLQSTHFRTGLTSNVEFELIYDGVFNQRTQSLKPGVTHRRSDVTDNGSGALTLRVRRNLVGNDHGPVAVSISEQLIVPTDASSVATSHIRGYELLAVSLKLPAAFSLAVNVQPGIARDSTDASYAFQFTSGATLYHNILPRRDNVQLYLEYYDTLITGPHSSDSRQVDLGVRWRPFKNVQFDAGCNFGVSADAPDYQPFCGMATRF